MAPLLSTAVTRLESGGSLEMLMFYSFAAVALLSALGVVLSRNIVRTAVCLLITLMAVAGLYFLLAANFVGAVQLIVYAGGTMILIIFGVMLTGKTMALHFRTRPVEVIAAAAVCGLILAGLLYTLRRAAWNQGASPMVQAPTIETMGRELLTRYLIPFEIISVLLLAAMIGAAYLARPEKR